MNYVCYKFIFFGISFITKMEGLLQYVSYCCFFFQYFFRYFINVPRRIVYLRLFFVCIDSSRIKKRKRRRNQLNKWRAIRNSHICTLFAQFLVNGSIFHKHHGANSISKHIFIRYGSNDHPSH